MQLLSSLRHRKFTLAMQIACLSAAFGLLVACGVVAASFWALFYQLSVRSSVNLLQKQDLLGHTLKKIYSAGDIFQTTHDFEDLLLGHSELHLALVNPVGNALLANFSSIALESIAATAPAKPTPIEKATIGLSLVKSTKNILSWQSLDKRSFKAVTGTVLTANGQPVRYYLSLDLQSDVNLMAGFAKAALLVMPLLLLLVAGGAWFIARSALSPLRRFNKLALTVEADSLSRRVSISGLPQELASLATDFNNMLARIDTGYARLMDFSGDLAHEMRTPIATLLGSTQVLLSRPRSPDELRAALESNINEMERLARLIADMLLIASGDSQQMPLQTERIELHDLAQQIADFLSILADEKNLNVKVSGHGTVVANRLLIQRAVTNLLSNAVAHAYCDTTIALVITSGNVTSLAVTNVGDGIAARHLDRIFDRFYRVDTSRARANGGTGLGLAIVRAIMASHHGTVMVSSQLKQSTTFTLTFA